MAIVACNNCTKHRECSAYSGSKMYCDRCAEKLGLKTAKVEATKTEKKKWLTTTTGSMFWSVLLRLIDYWLLCILSLIRTWFRAMIDGVRWLKIWMCLFSGLVVQLFQDWLNELWLCIDETDVNVWAVLALDQNFKDGESLKFVIFQFLFCSIRISHTSQTARLR